MRIYHNIVKKGSCCMCRMLQGICKLQTVQTVRCEQGKYRTVDVPAVASLPCSLMLLLICMYLIVMPPPIRRIAEEH